MLRFKAQLQLFLMASALGFSVSRAILRAGSASTEALARDEK